MLRLTFPYIAFSMLSLEVNLRSFINFFKALQMFMYIYVLNIHMSYIMRVVLFRIKYLNVSRSSSLISLNLQSFDKEPHFVIPRQKEF